MFVGLIALVAEKPDAKEEMGGVGGPPMGGMHPGAMGGMM